MSEEKNSVFRKKSVEQMQSPEALNDYLRVTSPGVWVFLGAVAAILIGVIIWGIFGRIETETKAVVVSENKGCYIVIPYEKLSEVTAAGTVTVEGEEYELNTSSYTLGEITKDDIALCLSGSFSQGDIVAFVGVFDTLGEGIYEGSVMTESFRPISLLLQ